MYGMEDQIARQKHTELYEEARAVRLARLARNNDGPSSIRAFLADVLNVHHTREKGA